MSPTTPWQILAAIDADAASGRPLLELLCAACATALDLVGAGVTLMNDAGNQGVVAASDRLTARLENLQLDLGEGPNLDAGRDSRPVFADLRTGAMAAWPGFGPGAQAAGVRSVLAFPLHVGALRLGSLCLYRSTPGDLDQDQTTTALAYADAAVAVLLHLEAQMLPGLALHPELGEPLEYRAEVHQATGFLAVQASVGLAEALLLLRAQAFLRDEPLVQVARAVLAGRLLIQPPGGEDG